MISSVPSYDEELLTGAYANIGLIADKGWAFHPDDPFRKLNHTLWVQNCKLTARYRENGNHQPRCVRDTISGSRLAQYGNYEYNEERERMYKPDDNIPVTPHTDFRHSAITEPWMLQEVEEHFARLSSRASLPLNNELLSQLRQSSTSKGLDVPGQVTGRVTQSKWNAVLKKRYTNAKNSNGKDFPPSTSYSTITDDTCHKNVDPEDYVKYPPLRYTVNNMAEMQLQINVTSDAVRDLWNPLKPQAHRQQQQKHFQYNHRQQPHVQTARQQHQQHHIQCNKQQQYLHSGLHHQTFGIRTGRQSTYPESIGTMRQLPPPMLSAEVPEFFPKVPMTRSKNYQEQSVPLQFFPSSASERSYQEELFPYNRGLMQNCGNPFQNPSLAMHSVPIHQVSNTSSTRQTHQWIQRPSPALHVQVPVCPPHQSICTSAQSAGPTIIQRRIQMPAKIGGDMTQQSGLPSAPIPVYQRPPELYNDPTQRRKTQGVDFNNLILLTKNAMTARRNQSKSSQQGSSLILEARQPSIKSESDVLQWLEKGYPKKAKDFVAVNILVSNFQNLEEKCDDENVVAFVGSNEDPNPDGRDATLVDLDESSAQLINVDPSSDAPTKRRLYRDVLTNSSTAEVVLENVFDKRYDELERQAMEQYRTSEECLALRYQELERQAMEQYRNNENGGPSTSKSKSPSPVTPSKKDQSDGSKSVGQNQDCVGGHKCSGFGHCSPIKDSPSPSEKGTLPPQQLTILRPESKPGISDTYGLTSHTECPRPAILTKSITTLNQRFSRDSKNITKGASGDKIDRYVKASSKRRLILMSPSKLELETRPLKSSDLEETYAVRTLKTHVSGAYRRPGVIRTGGGDEHVTILRSPGVEGIRKQLFLADEELMDSSPESLGVRLLEPTELDEPCTKIDLVCNLKDKIAGVSSGVSIVQIVDTARKNGTAYSTSGIHGAIWQQQEHKKLTNRVTRNKKKQCKPHDLAVVEEATSNRQNEFPEISITLLPRERKIETELSDVDPHDVPTSKERRSLPKPNPLNTFKDQNHHTRSSPCFSVLLETVRYHVSLCSMTNVDTSKLFVHKDSYSFLEELGFGTGPAHFENESCPQNVLMVRYYDASQRKSLKVCLMRSYRVLPLPDNAEVDDPWKILISHAIPLTVQTSNLSYANDCFQRQLAKFGLEAVCEVHFDVVNLLQVISPTHYTSVHLHEEGDNHITMCYLS